MREVGIVVCTWLHLVVLVVWIGHMANALILFEPLMSKYVKHDEYGDFIAEYRKRDAPIAISCIVLFFITGIFLMFPDEHYESIGNIFANDWSIVLFVKHILVLATAALGVYQGSRIMPKLADASKQLASQNCDKLLKSSIEVLDKARNLVTQVLCGLSAVVLLLTAVGQVL